MIHLYNDLVDINESSNPKRFPSIDGQRIPWLRPQLVLRRDTIVSFRICRLKRIILPKLRTAKGSQEGCNRASATCLSRISMVFDFDVA